MRPFKQVDVFSAVAFHGNPVAVVLQADGLSEPAMQRIAAWTGVPETTFVLTPTVAGADYRMRVFNPVYELPFAGHPTLGTGHAVLEAGLRPHAAGMLLQECRTGLVRLRLPGRRDAEMRVRRMALEMPDAVFAEVGADRTAALASALGAVPAGPVWLIDVGPKWIVTRIGAADALLALRPAMDRLKRLAARLDAVGVTVFAPVPPGGPSLYEVRSFTPGSRVDEDPVCGSGNGCVAAYLHRQGLASVDHVASQGACTGRRGLVHVCCSASGRVTIAGDCITAIDGRIDV